MAPLPKEFSDFFGRFGISQKSLQRIRFGGVVGKEALVGFATLLALAIVALKAGSTILLWGCLAAIVIVSLFTIGAMAFHGHKHPVEATLEGGEIVALQHLQQEFAAKGVGEIPSSPRILEGLGTKALDGATDEEGH